MGTALGSVRPASMSLALALARSSAWVRVRPTALTRRRDPSAGSGVIVRYALYRPSFIRVMPPVPFSRLPPAVMTGLPFPWDRFPVPSGPGMRYGPGNG